MVTDKYILVNKTTRKWLTRETFVRLQNMASEKIINLPPPASRLRETEFAWENFESPVFFPFIHDFTSEIKKDFANI